MLDSRTQASNNKSSENGDRGYISAPPAVSLPKGGGAIAGIGEKFSMNPVTGTGSLTIPIFVSPGRSGFSPQLVLSYDSGAGNSAFGLGWSLGVPSIRRKTQKGLPQYRDREDSDIFLLSGAEDLVPKLKEGDHKNYDVRIVSVPNDVLPQHLSSYPQTGTYQVKRYRPRIEGLFARIERWEHQDTGDVHWRSLTKDNVTSVYGKDLGSRVVAPEDSTRIFEWLLCESYDDKGNVIIYQYKQEDAANVDKNLSQEQNRLLDGHSYTQQYLKKVFYGNQQPFARDNWLFEVVFDYGEHDLVNPMPDVEVQPWLPRQDAFSSFRSGFEIRTQRLCQRVLMFHRFDEVGEIDATAKSWYLVRSTDLSYEPDPVATYLIAATQTGYKWDETAQKYHQKSYPPLELSYDRPKIEDEINSTAPESLENLPVGLDGGQYQWLDLDGEGISGILTEQAGGWFYKANLGTTRFAPLQVVATKPSLSNLSNSQQRFMDLAGDGQQDLVLLNREHPGFYERSLDYEWSSFKAFRTIPNSYEGKSCRCRRIVVQLEQPTRDGETQIALLTNLPETDAPSVLVAQLYRSRWRIETLFQIATQTFHCEIKTLGYPRAALFSFCMALVAYNLVSTLKGVLAAVHGSDCREKLSYYYLAEEVDATYQGMMIALPPEDWSDLGSMSLPQFSSLLQDWGQSVNLKAFTSNPRKAKKKKPKPPYDPNHPHVSTARLLVEKKKSRGSPHQ